jgi:phage terminase large subunit
MAGIQQMQLSELLNFTPKQQLAYEESYKHHFLFYGGAGGGGKSYWLRWAAVGLLMDWFTRYGLRDIRVMIACEDYPSLKERQLVRIKREFPEWLGTWRESAREFKLNPAYGGGEICFRNLDDPIKYSSSEFAMIGIDEATLSPQDIFDELRIRLRWKGLPNDECRMLLTGNPVGIGLGWVKKHFIDKVYDDPKEDKRDYGFVQAFVDDNPHVDPSYKKWLERLPKRKRDALLYGSFDAFEGQFFAEWDANLHVCEPFQIPTNWVRYRSLDWGGTAPASMGWWALSPAGILYRYKELYRPGVNPSIFAEAVKGMTAATDIIAATVCDPAIFKKDQRGDVLADLLYAAGIDGLVPSSNARIEGWVRVHEWLRPLEVAAVNAKTGERTLRQTARMQFFANCYHGKRVMPNMVHDKNNPEDMASRGVEDHIPDDVRYLTMFLPVCAAIGDYTYEPSKAQEEVSFREQLERQGLISRRAKDDTGAWSTGY